MSGKSKHVPIRTCVICREKADKRTMTRVVMAPEGLVLDPRGKMNGRGAYLCEKASCWERAASSDALDRALRTTLTGADRDRIRQGAS